MSADVLKNVTEAKVVRVKRGDKIFLRVDDRRLTELQILEIKRKAAAIWPDNEIVVGQSMDISVVRSDGA